MLCIPTGVKGSCRDKSSVSVLLSLRWSGFTGRHPEAGLVLGLWTHFSFWLEGQLPGDAETSPSDTCKRGLIPPAQPACLLFSSGKIFSDSPFFFPSSLPLYSLSPLSALPPILLPLPLFLGLILIFFSLRLAWENLMMPIWHLSPSSWSSFMEL